MVAALTAGLVALWQIIVWQNHRMRAHSVELLDEYQLTPPNEQVWKLTNILQTLFHGR